MRQSAPNALTVTAPSSPNKVLPSGENMDKTPTFNKTNISQYFFCSGIIALGFTACMLKPPERTTATTHTMIKE